MAWGGVSKSSPAHGDCPCPPTYTHHHHHHPFPHLSSCCPGNGPILGTYLSYLCPNLLKPANAGQVPYQGIFN